MSHFHITQTNNGKYAIECLFVVYRAKFGHHPTFLPQDEVRGKIEGFNTKFYYEVEIDLSEDMANERLKYYREKYDDMITKIEDDDKLWAKFPFRTLTPVYYK